jgi:hypothetical protein
MKYQELLVHVPEQWRKDFQQFVTSGDAPDEFLDFLDRDIPTQQAVEAAFADQVSNFEQFAEELNVDPAAIAAQLKRTRHGRNDPFRETSANLRNGILGTLTLQPLQKDMLSGDIAAAVAAGDTNEVIEFLEKVKEKISAVAGTAARGRR